MEPLPMHLTLDGEGPLTLQIVRALRDGVHTGTLGAGTRLPSSRELASQLGVSRNVVLAAFGQLLAEGYLAARPGAGTFIADDLSRGHAAAAPRRRRAASRRGAAAATSSPAATPAFNDFGAWLAGNVPALPTLTRDSEPRRAAFDFRYGQVSFEGVARQSWSRLLARSARGAGSAELGPVEGHRRLREAIAEHLRYARGVRADVDAVLITHGVQEAFDLATRLLAGPGRRVALEDPHYLPARVLACAHGADVAAVPVDALGLRTDALPKAPCALAYVTPSHQFPLGSVLPLSRRQELLDWARRQGSVVFEDDYDSQFRYDTRPIASLASLDRSRVIYASSFSKTISPGLRLGYVVLPDALVEPFRRLKALASSGATLVIQQALAAYLAEGHFARHLRRVGREYAAKRDALLQATGRHLDGGAEVVGAAAGVHVVLRLADRRAGEARTLLRRLRDAGVAATSIEDLYLRADRARPLELLLGYAATTPEQIERGVRRIATALG